MRRTAVAVVWNMAAWAGTGWTGWPENAMTRRNQKESQLYVKKPRKQDNRELYYYYTYYSMLCLVTKPNLQRLLFGVFSPILYYYYYLNCERSTLWGNKSCCKEFKGCDAKLSSGAQKLLIVFYDHPSSPFGADPSRRYHQGNWDDRLSLLTTRCLPRDLKALSAMRRIHPSPNNFVQKMSKPANSELVELI